jgi:hypothetical protein
MKTLPIWPPKWFLHPPLLITRLAGSSRQVILSTCKSLNLPPFPFRFSPFDKGQTATLDRWGECGVSARIVGILRSGRTCPRRTQKVQFRGSNDARLHFPQPAIRRPLH